MAEDKAASSFWSGVFVTIVFGSIVYSCSRDTTANEPVSSASPFPSSSQAILASPSANPTTSGLTTLPVPSHRYDAVEGSIYYYAAGVSDEERKQGKRAPDLLGFRYLGRNENGSDMVERIDKGVVISQSECARPCRVIHRSDGSTTGFDEGSIIGGVFADIAAGKLKKKSSPKPVNNEPEDWLDEPVEGELQPPLVRSDQTP